MDTDSRREAAVEAFWSRHLQHLHSKGIKAPADRWFVIHAEQYLKACPGKWLADHNSDDVREFLDIVGRRLGVADWQLVQVVDAIQKLFEVVGAQWMDSVD